MSDITFSPFTQQDEFIFDPRRVTGAFAGKRGGKTEAGAVKGINLQNTKPNYQCNGIDPYLGLIVAPTTDMLSRLSWKKFAAYARPFIKHQIKSPYEIQWQDHNPDEGYESLVYGVSADKPERSEGIKAHWVWIDEVFQVKEQFFLEMMARTADTEGYLFCTGSLGVNIINPKKHWAYKYFKLKPDDQTVSFEWPTAANPFFPKREIQRLKAVLDPKTFRMMFTIDWDTIPEAAVYGDFSVNKNTMIVPYNPDLWVDVCIDWGWAHPMAVGFFQYDKETQTVYMIDEIVQSRLRLNDLYAKIKKKQYKIKNWYCDIAGNQEREQTGRSNINHFMTEWNIDFEYSFRSVNYAIPIVRMNIMNGMGERKFIINSACEKTIDGLQQYKYPEKDGKIENENPVKEDDDCADMVRYYFQNKFSEHYEETITMIKG